MSRNGLYAIIAILLVVALVGFYLACEGWDR